MRHKFACARCVFGWLVAALLLLFAGISRAESSAPVVPVQLIHGADGWQLLRGGKPYFIKGAGGSASKPILAQLGANSFRTWGADDLKDQLDEAQRLGLTVTIGIWLRHEGDNFSYKNPAQVAQQYEMARKTILQYKDHPALLIWALGNETEGFKSGDNPLMWKAINNIAALTRKLDPNHPTMTVIAEIGGVRIKSLNDFCPDIQIVGINSYGGAASVGERYKKGGGVKPYIITEFGPPGSWEGAKNKWGIPLEATSTRKGEMYRQAYEKAVLAERGWCLGSYAFLWAHKQEPTATWYGLLLPDGSQLEAVHTLAELWSGHAPLNQCPKIKSLHLEGPDQVDPNQSIHASLEASDPDGDPLKVTWDLVDEAKPQKQGEQQDAPPSHPESIISSTDHEVQLKAPHAAGTYRLFVYVRDDHGNAATANVVFRVK